MPAHPGNGAPTSSAAISAHPVLVATSPQSPDCFFGFITLRLTTGGGGQVEQSAGSATWCLESSAIASQKILLEVLMIRADPCETAPRPILQSSCSCAVPVSPIVTVLPDGTLRTAPVGQVLVGIAIEPSTAFSWVPSMSNTSTPMSALIPGASRLVHRKSVDMLLCLMTPGTIQTILPVLLLVNALTAVLSGPAPAAWAAPTARRRPAAQRVTLRNPRTVFSNILSSPFDARVCPREFCAVTISMVREAGATREDVISPPGKGDATRDRDPSLHARNPVPMDFTIGRVGGRI